MFSRRNRSSRTAEPLAGCTSSQSWLFRASLQCRGQSQDRLHFADSQPRCALGGGHQQSIQKEQPRSRDRLHAGQHLASVVVIRRDPIRPDDRRAHVSWSLARRRSGNVGQRSRLSGRSARSATHYQIHRGSQRQTHRHLPLRRRLPHAGPQFPATVRSRRERMSPSCRSVIHRRESSRWLADPLTLRVFRRPITWQRPKLG